MSTRIGDRDSGQRCRCARDPDRRGRRPAVLCRGHRRAARCTRGRGRRRRSPTAAVECLRVEHGRPRYGIDLDDSVIPQEAGLNERAVSFTKGCYVGQETVARLYLPREAEPRSCAGCGCQAPAEPGDCSSRSRGGRSGRSGERRRVAAVRSDRARAGAPRGAAGSHGGGRRRRRRQSPRSPSCRSRSEGDARRRPAWSRTSCVVSGCEAR